MAWCGLGDNRIRFGGDSKRKNKS